MQVDGMMGSGSELRLSAEKRLERASGLVFLEPGRYVSVKSNLPKNKAHLACREFRRLAVWMYDRFLWSVHTMKGSLEPSNQ